MNARDEFAAILREAADAVIAAGLPVLTYEGYADAALASGWRPPRRVITDPAEFGRRARWHDDPGRVGRSAAVDRQRLDRHLIRWAATPAGAVAGRRAARSVIVIPGPRDRAVRHGGPGIAQHNPRILSNYLCRRACDANNMK